MIYMKAKKLLEKRMLKPGDDQDAFYLANCYVQLGNYPHAQQLFERSCLAMFTSPMLWERTSQPNWLVDICVLSGRIDLYPDVVRELTKYNSDRRGGSLVSLYSYALMEILLPSGQDISKWVDGLLKKSRVKDTYAIGLCLQAILGRDDSRLADSMLRLLEAHKGIATRGGLRESAEGLLCMPAMSLTFVAMDRSLKIEINNDYLSLGYLNYLRNESDPRK